MRRFELSDGVSNKFWEVAQVGCELHVCFGKIGTAGQRQSKNHADQAKATVAMEKVIREKTAKGYVETGGDGARPAPATATAATPASQASPTKPAPRTAEAAQAKASATAEPVTPPVPQAPPAVRTLSGDIAPWLAGGTPLDIPPAMAARALPSRRFPGPAPRATADHSWTLFLAYARGAGKLRCAESEDAQLQAAVDEATRRIAEDGRSGSALSDAVLLGFAACFDSKLKVADGTPFIDFLVAEKGLLYALETLLGALEHLAITCESSWSADDVWHVSGKTHYNLTRYPQTFSPTELALRAYLAHAPQALWERCAETLRGAVARLPIGRRALVAVLLPDLPQLANAMALERRDTMNIGDVWLRLCIDSPESLAAQRWVHSYSSANSYYNVPAAVASIVQERGVDAVPMLEHGSAIDATADALMSIGTPAALGALANGFIETGSSAALLRIKTAAMRWPLAAMAALAALPDIQNGTASPPLQSILTTLVQAHGGAVAAFRPWLAPQAMAVLEHLAASAAAPLDLADAAELPPVLVNPPWLRPRAKAAVPLALAPLPLAPALHWSDEERDELLHDERCNLYPWYKEQRSAPAAAAVAIAAGDLPALLAAWHTLATTDHAFTCSVRAIADMPAPYNAAAWNALAQYPLNMPGYAVARLGLDGLAGLVTMCEKRPREELGYARHVAAVELAAPMARAYATLKGKAVRATARTWLLAYPEHAACGLIASALGKAGAARDCAAEALRLLAAGGHEALLLEVADRYQQAPVNAALRALLEQDPLELYPAKIAPAPAFWMPASWTRPRLAGGGNGNGNGNGKALPDTALEHLGTMLRFPPGERPYAGITQVLQACDGVSLGRFAWDLFRAFQSAGMDAKENWAYLALGLLGNDEVARKLTPLLREWPAVGQHARAVAGLDILAAIGTDTAMLQLNGIAQKVKSRPLQEKAREKIDEIAEARGMSAAELEDRLVPDLGLDEHGALLLDFGPRQFRVGFDETLKPCVRDADGTRLADLPKPRQNDDAALSGAAVERYKLLKKDARAIAAQQVRRLELAMCAQRRWESAVFFTFLAAHPLLRHLVQRLVWGVWRDTTLLGCFRVGADGALTDGADDAFVIAQGDDVRIGLVHALELPAGDSAAFGQLFADYELMQPFAQLARDTHAPGADTLTRWDGVIVTTGHMLGLANRGWQRGPSQGRSYINTFTKALPGGLTAELHFEPGIMAAVVDEHPQQTLGQVLILEAAKRGRGAPSQPHPQPLAVLDPVSASELIRDIEKMRA